ncbi:MAG: cell division protein FtsL [Clostridia bacterium]|nr:cell division protein FtsL [Clostridia bacterium]
MILAKEKHDYRSWEVPKEAPQKKVRQAPKKQKKAQKGYLLIVILAFILGIVIAARYTQAAVVGYQLNKLNGELALLEKENQQLNVALNQLKSLDRIEKIATTKLGMVSPQEVQFVAIQTRSGNSFPGSINAGEREQDGRQAAKPGQVQGVLGALASVLYQWEKGSAPAEASTGN